MSDERTLHLPPGYVTEERAYGTVILDRATNQLALIATAETSAKQIEEAAWEDYADAIRDHIAACRVSVEFMAGEASGMSDRTAKIAGDAIDLFLEDRDRHGFGEEEARRRVIEDVSRGCGEGLEPVIRPNERRSA